MRPMMTGMKLFDGKVIRADQLYAALNQQFSGFRQKMGVVFAKSFTVPER